ncbi:MAG TPA: S41 family peptidase, partial [Spirochaetota bacterium]
MKKKFCVLGLLLPVILSGCSGSSSDNGKSIPELTADQKAEDFEYMYNILSENYPYFEVNKRVNGIDWKGNKDVYLKKIRGTSDNINHLIQLFYIMNDLKNGHDELLFGDNYNYFSDIYLNMYSTLDEAEPWRAVFKEAQPYYEDYWSIQDNKLSSPPLFQTHDRGRPVSKTFSDGESAAFEILEEGKIAYMKLSSMAQPSDSERKRIMDFYGKIKDYADLIIDIRKNNGGHAGYWTDQVMAPLISSPVTSSTISLFRGGSYLDPFLRAKGVKTSDIASLPVRSNYPAECKTNFTRFVDFKITVNPSSDTIGFKGKVYLLVGPDTFSSSESFAMFCKETGWATIVGTKTGGAGGEGATGPIVAILPN